MHLRDPYGPAGLQRACRSDADLRRVVEILEQYQNARFGMVDASTMAIAERLKIEVILTLDRRDFTIYRPRHCNAFRLVPGGIR